MFETLAAGHPGIVRRHCRLYDGTRISTSRAYLRTIPGFRATDRRRIANRKISTISRDTETDAGVAIGFDAD
jgi:hypothetical protein